MKEQSNTKDNMYPTVIWKEWKKMFGKLLAFMGFIFFIPEYFMRATILYSVEGMFKM